MSSFWGSSNSNQDALPGMEDGGARWFAPKKQPKEFTQSVTTKRDIWGRERHYDSRGREIKSPDVKAQKLKKAGWW